ncbi:MAG TPA: integrin alpha, partial [Niastella sp.]
MKLVYLLLFGFFILPVSQKISTVENTNTVPSPAFHFYAPLGKPFFEPSKTSVAADTNQLKESGWYATAMKNMAESEYHFNKVANTNRYSTPNRKNNLRFYYDENGFTVEPRTTQIQNKTLLNWQVAFNLDKKQIGDGHWQVNGNKAEYITENITVQYINNEEGMRQNFIVQKPVSNDDKLQLHFSVQTKLTQQFSKDRLQFADKQGGTVLSYEQLKVWDANGKPLDAAFEKSNTDYCIHVNTGNAAYPITIDPLSTTAATMLDRNQANAAFGISVAGAGDVNGDGYSDVIVGASIYDNGYIDEGVAFVYHGSATGISTSYAVRVDCNQANANFGRSVAGAGDVNGDGYNDVIVGAYQYSNGETGEGAAFVYHGSATGINTTAAVMVESNQADARMGFSVSGAGDVNSDGYNDVIVGAYLYNNGQVDEGAAFVYHGSATGVNTTIVTTIESNQADAYLGYSVSSAGDVNGDGYGDLIVGASQYDNGQLNEGAAFVYHGSATGINPTAAIMVESNQVSAYMGRSVASAGDVNSDGYSDVIVGANQYDNGQTNEGAAFVYHGSATGINPTAAVMVESNQADARLGASVASAGDVNSDGYSDVIVGANQYDNGQATEGAAFIYHGSAAGINATAITMMECNQAGARMGVSVACAGDVNGDGYSDVIVGANLYDNGQTDEGAAFVYHGSARGINANTTALVESNQVNAYLGCSVASAGDVNGDGYSDVIVGASLYDNGQTDEGAAFVYHGSATGISTAAAAVVESNLVNAQMGRSVSGAGDVNGDGYSDVIVGAHLFYNGVADEGAVFVYHGSATGINTTAVTTIESNQGGAYLGYSVASAGDVNGDGYSDVIVGAYLYDNNEVDEGAAFIYHGSATGISTTAASRVESNQYYAHMGYSVASAGDVNGDGYSDVIAGAYLYDNGEGDEGAAFIYHGSATGINTTAATRVESNQGNAYMGRSVASASDVNGDGYSDVIVGAYQYDNGQTNEGAAFVYHGSATGINSTVAVMTESNQAGAQMGHSIASAGDVNGDGYGDVIVGAALYDYGQT